jgi:hypothetical protein
MDFLQRALPSLLNPLAMLGMVVILVVFFLLQRRDLRDRIIKIAGSHDLKRTTEALDDAAQRLSRYFIMQTALNALFGVIVAVGLAVIGVPNPMLWGVLGMVLRFVPYIGAIISAAFPTALAIAVSPDWTMALWTIALFVVVEPVIGQVIEPLLYGHSTGVSPVAVILAATFWAWLWGPIGLLLSTPMTVCLAVLGRHIEWLQFVEVLIGREAPLSAPQRFYQRALAQDLNEVTDQAEELLREMPLLEYYDEVVLPGLLLAQIDFTRGLLDRRHIEGLNEVLDELIDELSSHDDMKQSAEQADSKETQRHPPSNGSLQMSTLYNVACLWGRGPFDKALASILVQLLERLGLKAELDITSDSSKVVRLSNPDRSVICLSSLTIGRSSAQIRYSIKKMRGRFSQAKVLLCAWGQDFGESSSQDKTDGDADCCASSFESAINCLRSEDLFGEPHCSGPGAVGPSAA